LGSFPVIDLIPPKFERRQSYPPVGQESKTVQTHHQAGKGKAQLDQPIPFR
jgi:hypothetical protein